MSCGIRYTALLSSGKNRFFPRLGKILYQVREVLISSIRTVRSQRIVFLASDLGLQKVSLLGKGIVIPKSIYKGIDFCSFIAGFITKTFVMEMVCSQ